MGAKRAAMKWLRVFLLVALVALPASAGNAQRLRDYVEGIVREYGSLGQKPFETRWPSGTTKEKYEVLEDGTLSYGKLFPTGGYAIKFQKKPSKAVYYEAWFGNGRTRELLNYDDRTIAYVSYYENGNKHERLMVNRLTRQTSYQAYDKSGKEVTR